MSQLRKLKITAIVTISTLCLACPAPDGVAHNGRSHPEIACARHVAELPPEAVKVVNRWQTYVESPSRQNICLRTTSKIKPRDID